MAKVVVIGGGASGLLASSLIAQNGNEVLLIEKNEKLGKKLYITGKGRCNVTNDCTPQEFLENVVTNPKFLMSAIHTFSSENLMAFLESNGLSLTVERGNRVFPTSNKSSDVIKTFERLLLKNNVKVLLNTAVTKIIKNNDKYTIITNKNDIICDKVVIATGGISYPLTGSTGDGYTFAKDFGHTIIKPKPSLCSIILNEKYVCDLEGLSLKNVCVTIVDENNKVITSEFGEMLFTKDGVSGPVILTISSKINKIVDNKKLKLLIDLKPALDEKQLDLRLIKDFKENINKAFKNSLNQLLPQKIIPTIIKLSGINENTKVNTISAENRKELGFLLKNLTFNVKGLDNIDRAVVTSGGVSCREINPKTMESKLSPGLYFIGEVIDVDAKTGGFNLQIAFSTAFSCSRAIG